MSRFLGLREDLTNLIEICNFFQEGKKKFEKQTIKFCQSQERTLNLSTKKQDNVLQEVGNFFLFKNFFLYYFQRLFNAMLMKIVKQADATLDMAERHFCQASLEYVFLLQEVQERKKFEFVETVSLFFEFSQLSFSIPYKFFLLFFIGIREKKITIIFLFIYLCLVNYSQIHLGSWYFYNNLTDIIVMFVSLYTLVDLYIKSSEKGPQEKKCPDKRSSLEKRIWIKNLQDIKTPEKSRRKKGPRTLVSHSLV